MKLANAMVAFACVALFGHVLSLFAYLGKIGYEQGWWGDGIAPISVAAALSLLVTVIVVRAISRTFG